jgi:ABC-2 type transport system ATP-binding protein
MVSGQSNNIIEAVGLSKVFNDFWFRAKARAVDGVDLEVRQGEVFGLLGPNGSGKSTTIKLILGLLKKTQGKLAVFGKDPSHVSIKKRIGYLPEETYMYRFLDARETLDYYGKLFGLDHRIRKRRVDELLDMVGLGQVAHRKVGEFSKGMARRIGIAQALINDPDLLILDEPTSGLDPLGTRQVKELIEQLGRKGTTILLSSHLLSDVEDVCDRMVILYGGKIRAEGTAKELLADSNHTVIRIPKISDQAISAVESTLERTAGVHIESVESPRQRLEDFFMGIVESARAEQAVTSGAAESGPTAAFLREEGAAGEDLIDVLSSDQSEDSPAVVERTRKTDSESRSGATGGDDKVLDELMSSTGDDEPKSETPTPLPKVDDSVDSGFIDDLLGDSDDERKE